MGHYFLDTQYKFHERHILKTLISETVVVLPIGYTGSYAGYGGVDRINDFTQNLNLCLFQMLLPVDRCLMSDAKI